MAYTETPRAPDAPPTPHLRAIAGSAYSLSKSRINVRVSGQYKCHLCSLPWYRIKKSADGTRASAIGRLSALIPFQADVSVKGLV